MSPHYDAMVIGGGIIGVAVGSNLARRGRRVLVVEQSWQQPCRTSPAFVTLRAATSAPNPAVTDLALASGYLRERGPSLFRTAIRPGGAVHLLASHRGQSFGELLDRETDWQNAGLDVTQLTKEGVAERYPYLNPEFYAAGLAVSAATAVQVNINAMHHIFQTQLVSLGGAYHLEQEFFGATFAGGCWQIDTSDGRVTADFIINAAGPSANDVALACGVPALPLHVRRRSLVLGRIADNAPPEGSPCISWLNDPAGLHIRIEPDGQVWLSALEAWDGARPPVPDQSAIAKAVFRFERRTQLTLRPHLDAYSVTAITSSDNGRPVIGWDPAASAFFWATGFGAFAVECATAVASLAADQFTRTPRERCLYDEFGIKPSDFEPDRGRRPGRELV